MNARGKMRKSRNIAALSAAVAALAMVDLAKGQTVALPFGDVYATNGSDIETTGPFQSAIGGIPFQFLPATGSGASFPGWTVLDFNTANIPLNSGTDVGTVGNDLTLNLWDDVFSSDIASNATMLFYLVTDNTTQINIPDANSPLRYINTTVGQTATFSGGLNGPGLTGGFAAGSTYYALQATVGSNGSGIVNGNAIYNNTLATNSGGSFNFIYSLTMPTAAEAYVQQQVNDGGNLRFVITTNSTAGGTPSEASYLGVATTQFFVNSQGNNVSALPTLDLDLQTQTFSGAAANTTLTLSSSSPYYVDAKDANVNLGRVLQGTTANTTLILQNVGTDNAQYREQIIGFANGGYVGVDPLPGGTSTMITIGESAADTAFGAGQSPNGQIILQDLTNGTDGNITINVQAHPVAERFVNTLSGTLTPQYGKILVGATATMQTTVETTNPQNGDFSSNSLELVTLLANAVATPFAPSDPFSSVKLANMTAVAPTFNQTFAGGPGGNVPENGEYVLGSVAIEHSGVYAPTQVLNALGTIKTYGNNDIILGNSGGTQNQVVSEQLPGEQYNSDSLFIYAQWTGYATAALLSSNSSALAPLSQGTIANLAANDNTYTLVTSGVTNHYNMGLRAQAWVTGISFNQTGWSQSGLSPVTVSGTGAAAMVTNAGTTISAPNNSLAGILSNTGTTATFSLGALDTTNKLDGTYGAIMSVTAENEQDITGAGANDLPAQNFALQGTVSYSGGTGSGSYILDGGTYTADPSVVLSGSFLQSGGTATFPQLNGNGNIDILGGSNASMIIGGGGSFTGNIVNNAALTIVADPTVVGNISGGGSLSIIGSGTLKLASNSHTMTQSALTLASTATLDISNNTVLINFGAGNDPTTTLVAALAAGYNASGALWSGVPGAAGAILSSTAAANNAANATPILSVGYGDGNVDTGAGTTTATPATAGQLLIKLTLAGDANLDGNVDFNDLFAVGKTLNTTGNDWAAGDFTYDPSGAVTFTDLFIIGQNLNQTLGTMGSSGIEIGGSTIPIGQTAGVHVTPTIVPEPGSLALIGAAGFGLLARKRKRAKPTA